MSEIWMSSRLHLPKSLISGASTPATMSSSTSACTPHAPSSISLNCSTSLTHSHKCKSIARPNYFTRTAQLQSFWCFGSSRYVRILGPRAGGRWPRDIDKVHDGRQTVDGASAANTPRNRCRRTGRRRRCNAAAVRSVHPDGTAGRRQAQSQPALHRPPPHATLVCVMCHRGFLAQNGGEEAASGAGPAPWRRDARPEPLRDPHTPTHARLHPGRCCVSPAAHRTLPWP